MSNIALNLEDNITQTQLVVVDYANLPFRCQACHSWNHLIKNCNETTNKLTKGPRGLDLPTRHMLRKNKGPIVDEDGF